MAEVTRRVIIEVETRQKKSRLDAPDVGSAERAFKAESEAAKKATESTTQATEAVKRHSNTVRNSSVSIVRDFREAGEGALRLTRGLALLSASGSDDLKKLVQSVALAQGAFDVFAGGFKVITNLASSFGNPAALAITGVTAAISAGAVAWGKWQAAANAAVTKAKADLANFDVEGINQRFEGLRAGVTSRADRRLGLAIGDNERESQLRAEITRLQGEREENRRDSLGGFPTRDTFLIRASAARLAAQAGEKEANLQKELQGIQEEQLREQKRLREEWANSIFGSNSFVGQAFGKASDLQFDQQSKELTQRTNKLIKDLLDIVEHNEKRADALKRTFDQTNPK
jgi:hypothetical protein